jgi:hypothetical protein
MVFIVIGLICLGFALYDEFDEYEKHRLARHEQLKRQASKLGYPAYSPGYPRKQRPS